MPWEKLAVIPDTVSACYMPLRIRPAAEWVTGCVFWELEDWACQGIQLAIHYGAEVYCTSRQDSKLELASKFGAHYCLNSKRESLVEKIRDLTDGEMCDVVFDNIGIASSIQTALDLVRPADVSLL